MRTLENFEKWTHSYGFFPEKWDPCLGIFLKKPTQNCGISPYVLKCEYPPPPGCDDQNMILYKNLVTQCKYSNMLKYQEYHSKILNKKKIQKEMYIMQSTCMNI